MKLADTPIGCVSIVERVGGERSFRRRLMELGLVPGTRVRLVGVAPLGDPMQLLIRGCNLSIRRSEALCITVTQTESCRVQHLPSCATCACRTGANLPPRDGAADAA